MPYKFELTKPQAERHAELSQLLEAAVGELQAAEEVANEKIGEIIATLNQKIDAFNAVLEKAHSFVTEIHEEAQRQIDAKSERWQQSEAGEAASEWQTAWENADLSPVETIGSVVIDKIEYGVAEEFAELPPSV